jgi:hypothetical protein
MGQRLLKTLEKSRTRTRPAAPPAFPPSSWVHPPPPVPPPAHPHPDLHSGPPPLTPSHKANAHGHRRRVARPSKFAASGRRATPDPTPNRPASHPPPPGPPHLRPSRPPLGPTATCLRAGRCGAASAGASVPGPPHTRARQAPGRRACMCCHAHPPASAATRWITSVGPRACEAYVPTMVPGAGARRQAQAPGAGAWCQAWCRACCQDGARHGARHVPAWCQARTDDVLVEEEEAAGGQGLVLRGASGPTWVPVDMLCLHGHGSHRAGPVPGTHG